jgi:glycosyltransferase involved in cell wall biosynthesis
MKRIAILLPGPRREPVGGYKVLYQYGDHLASNGWKVDFIYLTNQIVCYSRFSGILGKLKEGFLSIFSSPRWFVFKSKNVNHRIVKELKENSLVDYRIIICSSVETFIYISEKKIVELNKIIYFVQDYECWNVKIDKLNETLSHKDVDYITISDDLNKKITFAGGNVALVLYNGINKADFYNFKKWELRPSSSFLFLYHPSKRKGCDALISALKKVNENSKHIKFSCFSAYPKPKDFPEYISYYHRPTLKKLNDLYNNNKFFICSSEYEGFGLTPAEAAFAGEIVLTTKNGGVEQYIENGENGFIIPGKNSDAFVQIIYDIVAQEPYLAEFSRTSSHSIGNKLNLDLNFNKLLDFINNKIRDKEF